MFWKRKKAENKSQDLDFLEFKKDILWFVKESDEVSTGELIKAEKLSVSFQQTFPKLTELIYKARILPLTINGKPYRLYSWTDKEGRSLGWLIEIEQSRNGDIQLCPEHEMLLEEIGGIRESYNQPEPSLTNNQNFLFIESECSLGIGGWDDYYQFLCEQAHLEQMDYSKFVCFSQEANGDVTLYNPENKRVMLFAHDQNFDHAEPLENQPEYSFYRIKNVTSFVDYVEELANQWKLKIDQ